MTATSPLCALQSIWQETAELADQAVGIGIDLVEVGPLLRLVAVGGQSFVDAAWTPREQREANAQAEGLAGKWAAKEAVMKVLQRGIGDLDPRDVEIITDSSGAPRVELHRGARAMASRRRITTWHVSLTHDGGWAAAIAIASSLSMTVVDTAITAYEGRNRG
ncbi:MAG: holo-ACP synthase [Actinomycetota bacterium]